ncbi:MAG: type II toxin-antitoxin system HicA family toxin [bacterium]
MLREAGCYFERPGKGDHEIWFSPITQIRFVVDSAIKSRHTANAVLKQAGLPKRF